MKQGEDADTEFGFSRTCACSGPRGGGGRHAVCAHVLWGLQGADLIVHDGAQTHDADMDVVFFADQSGVLQGSAARERVTAERQ